jgi:hypothetical protein
MIIHPGNSDEVCVCFKPLVLNRALLRLPWEKWCITPPLAVSTDSLFLQPRIIRNSPHPLAGLAVVQDRPVTALEQLEEIQIELAAKGTPDSEVSRQIEQLQESFLRRRGFQPPWERYF